MNVIEATQTKWASQIVFVPEKHGTLLIFIHYQKLRSMKIHDLYPFPTWTNVLTCFITQRYFRYKTRKQMLQSQYCPLGSRLKCLSSVYGFSTLLACPLDWRMHQARFYEQCISFSWNSSGSGLLFRWHGHIFAHSIGAHQLVIPVHTLLYDAWVTFSWENCEFFTIGIHHLGDITRPERSQALSETNNDLAQFESSTNVTEIR